MDKTKIIDLHFHNHASSSDQKRTNNRNISNEDLKKLIIENEIGLLAVVTHIEKSDENFQKWIKKNEELINLTEELEEFTLAVGVELNIEPIEPENNPETKFWHSLIITDKKNIEKINNLIKGIIRNSNNNEQEQIIITLEELNFLLKENGFNKKNSIFMPHYSKSDDNRNINGKRNNKEILEKIQKDCSVSVFPEVNNLTSMKINFHKGTIPLIGSDSQSIMDWKQKKDKLLKTIYFFEDFEKFILFINKDSNYINDLLDKFNTKQELEEFNLLVPKEANSNKKDNYEYLPINNFYYRKGINLIFGKRGSGKSILLNSLKKIFEISEFESYSGSEGNKQDLFSQKVNQLVKENINKKINDNIILKKLKDETLIKKFEPPNYYKTNFFQEIKEYFEKKQKKPFSLLTMFSRGYVLNENNLSNSFAEFEKKQKKLSEFIDEVKRINKKYKDNDNEKIFKSYLSIIVNIFNKKLKSFLLKQNIFLTEKIITEINEINEEEGGEDLPKFNFSSSENKIINYFVETRKILKELEKITNGNSEILFDKSNFSFGEFKIRLNWKEYPKPPRKLKKNILSNEWIKLVNNKKIKMEQINKFFENFVFVEDFSIFKNYILNDILDEEIEILNNMFNNDNIFMFLTKEIFHEIKGERKTLSNGQIIEFLFNETLNTNKKIIFLDEMDYSLDSIYINDFLIPQLEVLSKKRKIIFLATHSAILAINSRPINWIFREEKGGGEYKTFIGDLYSNKLINIKNNKDIIKWNDTVINIFEGGEEALEERGFIYGKNKQ